MLRAAHLSRVALLAAVSAAGCAAIIGFPDYYGPGAGGAGGGGTSSASGTGGAISSASAATASTAATSGSTGSAGTGGTGGSTGCQDGTTCYLGLDGTAGVGPCAAGTLSCEGGVPHCSDTRPALQACSPATSDGNCDGIQGCTGQYNWAQSGFQAVLRSAAASVDGSAAVTGTLDTAVPAGGAFVDAFDAKGRSCWSAPTYFGGGGSVIPAGVALSGSKKTPDLKPTQVICAGGTEMAASTVVVGQANGAVNFGAGILAGAGVKDAFIAVFGPTGAISWGKLFGSPNDDAATAVAVGPQGEIYVTGHAQGAVSLPGCAPATGGVLGTPAAFVAKLTADGTCTWLHTYPGGGASTGTFGSGIAVTPDGTEVYAVGRFNGTVEQADAGALLSGGTDDTFVLRIDSASGAATASKSLGLQNTGADPTVAVAAGGVFVAGNLTGSFSTCTGTNSKAYLAALGPGLLGFFGGGPFCYSAGTADVMSYGVAVDAAGNVVLSLGSTAGAIQSSGAGFPTPIPAASVVAVKLSNPYSNYLWAQAIAPTGAAYGGGVAVDGMGDVVITANTNTSYTLGTQTVGGSGVAVVAGLAP